MEPPVPVAPDEGDLHWSDGHSMDSDDGHLVLPVAVVLPRSPPWVDAASVSSVSTASMSSAASHLRLTGQLSPISTGMDIPGAVADDGSCRSAASSVSTAPRLASLSTSSSSCNDGWSIGGFVDPDEAHSADMDGDIHWEHGADDVLAIPKLEPMDDDDFRIEDVKEAPLTPVASSSAPTPAQLKTKRPRGRPRKHPLNPAVTSNKITKGRSKTGCITCRKRKKKCDEAKPRCMNCEKNAVVCEGYPEKQIWRSGRERAEEGRLSRTHSLPVITMQPIFNGLETPEDMMFWRHYNDHLSAVLTVEGEHKNAFKDMLVPIATRHQGLMHSILALSSKHLDCETPYGVNFLKKHPGIDVESLQRRADYHHEKAMERLYEDMGRQENKDDPDYSVVLAARYGQMLCLLLESLIEGNPRGVHRVHLQAYQALIQHSPPEDPGLLGFLMEFFQYHIFADELIRFPDLHKARLATEDWAPLAPIFPARLLGVADGLFNYLSKITSIRNRIRINIASQVDPVVDYTSLYRAAEIDAAIRDWAPQWPPGDSRDRVSLLYKQMMWVYLFRTIYPPSVSSAGGSAATSSTSLATAPTETSASEPSSSLANTPPRSTASSRASTPSPTTDGHAHQRSRKRPLMTTKAVRVYEDDDDDDDDEDEDDGDEDEDDEDGDGGRASPPPIRRPPDHDSRITIAVDESLAILDSFKPSDPAQTLLLIPCLVIGTACFAPSQQERVRTALRKVRGYTGLRNTDRVGEVLEEVWRLMARGDWVRVWDWQGIARDLGADFLCS